MAATAAVFPRTTVTRFPFLFLGVVVAAWLGGRAPGLLALVLNLVFAAYYFVSPAGLWDMDAIGSALVLLSGAIVALLVGSLRTIIRELEESRQSYRNTNELLSLAFESSQSGSYVWDAKTNENTWSPELLALYGFGPDESLARYEDWLECVLPEDREVATDGLRAALASGVLSLEFRIRRHDTGAVRWLEGRGRVFYDQHDRPSRVVGINVDITERKRLEASQRHAASVPEMSPNPIVEADRDGTVSYQNPAARRLLPGLVERGLEHPWLAGWPALARAVCEGGAEKVEREVAVGDRVYHQVLVCPPGELTVRSYALDVTARVRTEQELRRERDFTSAVIEVTSSLVVVFDAHGRVVRFNRACQSTTGYTEGEALGRSFELFIPPDERPSVAGVFERLAAGQFPSHFENHWLTKGGTQRLLSWSNTALLDDDGNVAFVVGTGVDITERRAGEEALRRSNEQLQLVQDAAGMGAWDWDLTAGTLTWSAQCKALFGLEADTVMSYDTFITAVHPDDRQRVDDAVRASLRTGHPYEVEMRVQRPDGRLGWVASKGRAFFDSHGRATRMSGMALDITWRKEAEEALREANTRKNEFLAMLSHELRNPLAPIQNSLFLLEHAGSDSAQARRAVRVIDRQVRHMTRLIDDLLDVTRIARGKVHLQRERLDLVDLVRRTAEDHRPVFTRLGITFEVNVAPAPIFVNGDATRLSQVIGNLLSNAAKFTPPGGSVTLAIRGDGEWVEVQVRDDGVGIAAGILDTLFQPFVQADQTLDRSKGGLGLGLSLVKGLVNLHGGTVLASSDGPSRGSVFTVRLPLERRRRSRVTATTKPSSPPPPHRILVIEDSADAAESLKEALELCGHIVETAATADEGMSKARVFSPDLVLCDIGLPGRDGYEVARMMRSDPVLSRVRLVALSGYASPEDVDRAHGAGFDEHVPKPMDLPMLERVLMTMPRDSRAS